MYEENGKQLFANNAHGELIKFVTDYLVNNFDDSTYDREFSVTNASSFPEITPNSGDYYLITLSAQLKPEYIARSLQGDGILRTILKVTAKTGNVLRVEGLSEKDGLQEITDSFVHSYVNPPIKVEMLLTAGTMRNLAYEPAFAVGQIKTTAQYLEATEGDPIIWLPADGKSYQAKAYPELAVLINPSIDPKSTTTFAVPNLANPAPNIRHYIKAVTK